VREHRVRSSQAPENSMELRQPTTGLLAAWRWQLPFGPRPMWHDLDLRVRIRSGQPASDWPTPWFIDRWPAAEIDPAAARRAAEVLAEAGVMPRGLPNGWGGDGAGRYLCPYDPDRAGLVLEHLRMATAIDVRLHGSVDRDRDLCWPPDVSNWDQLASKFQVLRELAPQAALLASLDAAQADTGLDRLWTMPIDGVLIRSAFGSRAQRATLLAELLQAHRGAASRAEKAILVASPLDTVEDAVKLLCCGASAVGLDDLLRDAWPRRTTKPSPAAIDPWAVPAPVKPPEDRFEPTVRQVLHECGAWFDRLAVRSVDELPADSVLAPR